MKKKKPFRVLEERRKHGYIKIVIFKTAKTYSCSLLTSIGEGGMAFPNTGVYRSCFEAKNAALRCIQNYYHSPLQSTLLSKFRIMKDIDQPCLFDDV
jgi:hypothetical protein